MASIILVRHGETDLNHQDRLRGSINIPLNDTGLLQAQENARELTKLEVKPARIVTSSLKRARQTADPIKQYLQFGGEIEHSDELKPWFLGELEGSKIEQYLDDMLDLMRKPDEKPPLSYETFNDFVKRNLSYINECMGFAVVNDCCVVIVTHTRNIRTFLSWAQADFGDSIDMNTMMAKEDPIGTAGHLIVEHKDGKWVIEEGQNHHPTSDGGS